MHPYPQDHVIREQREREAADMATWGCNTARNLVSKSTMGTPNPEQPAPVPDAGVREKVKELLLLGGQWDFNALADRILALFPAPTPATSEDTLKALKTADAFARLVMYGCSRGSIKAQTILDMSDPNATEWPEVTVYDEAAKVRQALRAAMAHAGAQKT